MVFSVIGLGNDFFLLGTKPSLSKVDLFVDG